MGISNRFKLPMSSLLPLRDQICEIVSESVSSNSVSVGQSLPSCRKLSKQLNVSKNTVYLAYARLIDMGLLISKDRSGYYLNPDYDAVSSIADNRTRKKLRCWSKAGCQLKDNALPIFEKSNTQKTGASLHTRSFIIRLILKFSQSRAGGNVCVWH